MYYENAPSGRKTAVARLKSWFSKVDNEVAKRKAKKAVKKNKETSKK